MIAEGHAANIHADYGLARADTRTFLRRDQTPILNPEPELNFESVGRVPVSLQGQMLCLLVEAPPH